MYRRISSLVRSRCGLAKTSADLSAIIEKFSEAAILAMILFMRS